MTDDWADFGIDLHLALDPRDKAASLADGVRDAIRAGRLTPGTRLPASRGLAADLGIARNTVAEVYALLTAEGWLAARTGAGTWVAARSAPAPSRPREHPPTAGRLDLRGGIPDASTFPRAEWAASVRRATQTAPADALGYAPPLGLPQLQTVLADYLARARGVIVGSGHVVTGRGFADLLALVARTLVAGGARTIAVEQYGHATHRGVLAAAGLRLVPIPVDDEGADIAVLEASHADAVLLTPAHQFPTGVPLSPARRVAVTGWARRTGALVLEDDYDGEFATTAERSAPCRRSTRSTSSTWAPPASRWRRPSDLRGPSRRHGCCRACSRPGAPWVRVPTRSRSLRSPTSSRATATTATCAACGPATVGGARRSTPPSRRSRMLSSG